MKKVIAICILAVLLCVMLTGCTESYQRNLKSVKSNWAGGLNRTLSVYSYDGDLLRTYSGKFDVSESENEVFFDLDGKRVIIHGGIVINEED